MKSSDLLEKFDFLSASDKSIRIFGRISEFWNTLVIC